MKFAFALIALVISFQAHARTFNCTTDDPLWSVIQDVRFSYDVATKAMSMTFSDDSGDVTLTGTIDTHYKSRSGAMVRFAKADGDSDYRELSSESYVCEILASQSLVAAGSTGGTLTLRCRGESFENGKYVCK